MANAAWVSTQKEMTPGKVTDVLNSLSDRIFKGEIIVEHHDFRGVQGAWADNVWMLTNKLPERAGKGALEFWLKTPWRFEMEHREGSNFMWWVGSAAMNEIAIAFSGVWRDEGLPLNVPMRSEVGRYDDFHVYMNRNNSISIKGKVLNKLENIQFRVYMYLCAPDAFLPEDLKGKNLIELHRRMFEDKSLPQIHEFRCPHLESDNEHCDIDESTCPGLDDCGVMY